MMGIAERKRRRKTNGIVNEIITSIGESPMAVWLIVPLLDIFLLP